MARKFRGTEHVRLDGKGRMSIPARMRRVFDAGDPSFSSSSTGRTQLVVVYGPEWWNWLELYTIEAVDEIDAQIDQLARGSKKRRWLEQLMNGQSTDLEIDREGRLVLPMRLRDRIGLSDGVEAVFASHGDYIKVYHPDSPPKDIEELEAFTATMGPGFDPREFLSEIEQDEG